MRNTIIACIFSLYIFSCSGDLNMEKKTISVPKEEYVTTLDYSIIKKIPHDTTAFTEGLLFHEGKLFESTGSPEDFPQSISFIGTVNLNSGNVTKKIVLEKEYFGEGIAILNNKIYQLTYKNNLGFVYDKESYKLISRFNFENKEGWGLTTDGMNLIMSDGTNILTYLDPITLKPVKKLNVTNGGYAEDYLNELEFINGAIYANIWTKNYIAKIDTATGKVIGLINLEYLSDEARRIYSKSEVLNGIAWDEDSNKVYVTGKFWPYIYQIEFNH